MGEHVQREADLFEAGEYADRNLTVTPADIARLAGTEGEVPIDVEHAGGKIKLGFVDQLRAAGSWLKGRVNLLPEADALLERLGVRQLSVAVPRDLSRLLAVSVTGAPRVAGARMFSGGSDTAECVFFALGETAPATGANDHGGVRMADEARTVTVEEFAALKASQGALEAKLAEAEAARVQAQAEAERHGAAVKAMQFSARVERADRMLEKWSNRIPPAAREEAKALLLTEGVVKFADGEKDSAELFAAFCEKLPVQKPAALTGGAGAPSAEVKFTDDEKAFYAKAFPGLKLEDIAAANPELFAGR